MGMSLSSYLILHQNNLGILLLFQIPESILTSQLLRMDKSERDHRTPAFSRSPFLTFKLEICDPNLKSTDLLFLVIMNYL